MMMNDHHMMLVCQFRGDTARNWGRFGQILDPSLVEPAFWGIPERIQLSGFQNLGLRFKAPGWVLRLKFCNSNTQALLRVFGGSHF